MARRFWRPALALLASAAAGLMLWAFWLEPASLTVAEDRLAFPLAARGSVRIAILTDLHVGSPFNGLDKLRDIVRRTNAARPDIVCILGDLVIHGVPGGRFVSPEDSSTELRALSAPNGVVAVLGNHDGWLDHERVRRALEQNGIRMLEEQAEQVPTPAGPLWFAGISDLWTGRHDIGAALSAVTNGAAPIILMTHNPDVFPNVPDRVTLTIAGHTHGGQVRLPLIGTPIVPSRYGSRYAAGHIVEGGRHLYVATGLGTSVAPIRFRVPPAIAVLTLVSE